MQHVGRVLQGWIDRNRGYSDFSSEISLLKGNWDRNDLGFGGEAVVGGPNNTVFLTLKVSCFPNRHLAERLGP